MIIRLAVAFLALAATAHAQRDFSSVTITSEEAGPGVYVLYGAGGNIGLCYGDEAVFLVDDQFAPLSERILAEVERLSGRGVDFVLNTHYHFDHTGGNENLGESGALIFGHENVRIRVVEDNDAPGDAPVITFSERQTFHINDLTVKAIHVPHAHTDGDSLVVFEGANVIHTGDTMFAPTSGTFPYIDLEGGGSINGAIAAAEAVVAMSDDETVIIPGHGRLTDKEGAEAYLAMLTDIRDQVQAMINGGSSKDDIVGAGITDPYAEGRDDGFIKPDVFVATIYDSLTAN
ncbi:MAG: MBL fold metallo-hydrolase [Pseudomonadota bacterium]